MYNFRLSLRIDGTIGAIHQVLTEPNLCSSHIIASVQLRSEMSVRLLFLCCYGNLYFALIKNHKCVIEPRDWRMLCVCIVNC
jgi:hypothetical protein